MNKEIKTFHGKENFWLFTELKLTLTYFGSCVNVMTEKIPVLYLCVPKGKSLPFSVPHLSHLYS